MSTPKNESPDTSAASAPDKAVVRKTQKPVAHESLSSIRDYLLVQMEQDASWHSYRPND
jgi:hypothetical protein